VRYSLAVRTIEDNVLPYCQNNDITVIAYSPLARKGDFSASGLEDARAIAGLEGSCDDLAQRLEKVAAEIGKTPAQVMLNWVVSQPQVITIPKTDRVERVDEAVGALGWTLNPAQRAALTGS
jgi:diketogulonate reductase-like aldo/keto reductase